MKYFLPAALLIILCFYSPVTLTEYAPEQAVCYIYCQASTAQSVDCGGGCIVSCSGQELDKTLKLCEKIQGVSFTYKAQKTAVANLIATLDARVIFDFSKGETYDLYLYSPRLIGGVYLEGRRVNAHIHYANGVIHVGSPVILGSF